MSGTDATIAAIAREWVRLHREAIRLRQDRNAMDYEHHMSCGHVWTMRHTACPVCFVEIRAALAAERKAHALTRRGGGRTYDRAEAEVARLTATTADAVKLAELYQTELKAEREAHAKTKAALAEFVRWHGPAHEEGCSEDDTCNCAAKPANDAVNDVLRDYPLASTKAARRETCCQHVGDDVTCQTCDALQRAERVEATVAKLHTELDQLKAICAERRSLIETCMELRQEREAKERAEADRDTANRVIASIVAVIGEQTDDRHSLADMVRDLKADKDRAEAIVRKLRKEIDERIAIHSRNTGSDASMDMAIAYKYAIKMLDELEGKR